MSDKTEKTLPMHLPPNQKRRFEMQHSPERPKWKAIPR